MLPRLSLCEHLPRGVHWRARHTSQKVPKEQKANARESKKDAIPSIVLEERFLKTHTNKHSETVSLIPAALIHYKPCARIPPQPGKAGEQLQVIPVGVPLLLVTPSNLYQ